MARCPPGVICLESTVFILAGFVVLLLGYYVVQQSQLHAPVIEPVAEVQRSNRFPEVSIPLQTYGMPSIPPPPGPVFYGSASRISGRGPYQQVGFLSGNNQILPLMGRPLAPARDTWQYYTASDTGYGVQLPVSKSGKSCTGEYGCTSLWNGDQVYVEGYNQVFKVTMYERNGVQYSPYV